MNQKISNPKKAIIVLITMLCATAMTFAEPVQNVPSFVEVYWQGTKQLMIPGATMVVAVDPDEVNAELSSGSVTFYGMKRGAEGLVLVYFGDHLDQPSTIRVRVVDQPSTFKAPTLKGNEAELAHITIASQTVVNSDGNNTKVGFVNGVSWDQNLDRERHLTFTSDNTAGSLGNDGKFNFRNASLGYFTPKLQVRLIDSTLNLFGDSGVSPGPQTYQSDVTTLRGGAVSYKLGETNLTFYGGTSMPYYFLSLSGTSDLAGFSFNRHLTSRISMFGNSAFMNNPLTPFQPNSARESSVMQTLGFDYRINKQWWASLMGGVSNHGSLGRAEVHYSSRRLEASVGVKQSADDFPTNLLAATFTSNNGVRASASFKQTDRFTESVVFERAYGRSAAGGVPSGTYEYISPGVSVQLTRNEFLNVQYTHNTSEQPGQGSVSNGQFNGFLNSKLSQRYSNTFQMQYGALQAPWQYHAGNQFNLRDSFSVVIPRGMVNFGYSYDRTGTSLIQQLQSQLSILPPALQQAFLADPIAFINSGALTPELRALLVTQTPSGNFVSVGANLRLTQKLSFDPTFTYNIQHGLGQSSSSPNFAYGVRYQVTRTFEITSSLNYLWYLSQGSLQKTTYLSFGFIKSFDVAPAALVPAGHARIIQGYVYRDNNINGAYNAGEPGLAGIRVQIDQKEIAVTDSKGRYRFNHVSAGVHDIALAISDFKGEIRLTTSNLASVDLTNNKQAEIDFGVVNFARVIGHVYNDSQFDGHRLSVSKGLAEVKINIEGGALNRTITSGAGGDFNLTDVAPGDYKAVLDESSLPSNYTIPQTTFNIHVDPISTTVLDVPVRALRSISGKVMLRLRKDRSQGQQNAPQGPPEDYETVPLAGITIVAGDVHAQSSADGSFLLRNLPAGDLTVTIAPVKQMPAGMNLPTGHVHMPEEPTEIHDATIVISNPTFLPYLLGKTVEQIRHVEPEKKPPTTFKTIASK